VAEDHGFGAPGWHRQEVCRAVVAQLVERVLGKDEVTSSILVNGSSVLKYFVYVLRSVSSRKHYIGIAADVERRLDEHNMRSGRWTNSFKPWELVAREEHPDRGAAGTDFEEPGRDRGPKGIVWRRKNLIAASRT
jgi:predicted GIY-YIG superfamily endonuclease